MISHTTPSRNEAQPAAASNPNRQVKRARNWHALKASLVTPLLGVNRNQGLSTSDVATRGLRYGSNNSETVRSQHITGMLLLLLSVVVVGFLLTATILNSTIGDNLETFAFLVVVVIGAIVGFADMLKSAQGGL